MKLHSLLLPLAALTLTAPLAAKPADYAAAVADKDRNTKNREQDESRKPAEVLAFAGIMPGQTVVDYFSGEGYWAELFSRSVGKTGIVYETDPVDWHDAKVWEPILAKHANIRTLAVPVAAMSFAPRSIDVLFINANYHDLYWESEKYKFPRVDVPAVLADWFRAIKPGGHVVIVDHVGPAGDPRDVVEKMHRIDPERVKADMAAAGFVLEAESDSLRRSDDGHDKSVFDPAVRGKTDRFILKFRHP